MKKKIVTIQNIANHFGLIWLNGDRNAMKKQIVEITVNRPGLELACFFGYPRSRKLILIGNKETAFINQMSEESLRLAFDFLFVDECPGCIICSNNDCNPEVLKIAKEKNISINQLATIIDANRLQNNLSSAIRIYILNYLKEQKAEKLTCFQTFFYRE